ncbi:hypothetical protein [Enterobacter cloacae]|uniref:hypothetical protein n=1 Tax=Enterobacter cloacae TaxID=550 RepID=UPI000735DC88|nr:hypothetical protein [Enterobacter cloacae]KTH21236.1 hypothetical protein ASV29_02795 [Enterobacter cloacae subsp. cloacae]KTH22242.1 hypothetical protein ASV28_02930 [Enterobacter cloacae subsp. cloacae]MUI31375.1 hypothetical protein [Enterobacter cloacae]HCL5591766.1 hypothetical protein [Enterobacter cloacae]HCT5168971.1 hypothetical protein [Enterobacter cloacae]
MKILLSPQRADATVTYSAQGDVLTVTMDGKVNTFDFSDMQDEALTEFSSSLPICPLLYAKRTDEGVIVSALHFYGPEADNNEKVASVITF